MEKTNEDQTGATSDPVNSPQQMTDRDFRRLRAKYFTVTHKRMEPCGHRLDQINEPRNNCEFCWFAFFQTHGELVQTADRAYQEQGAIFIDKLRGVKFRKMFLRFMSTVAMFKTEVEAAKAASAELAAKVDTAKAAFENRENDEQTGTNESGDGIGEGVGQEVRNERDVPSIREEGRPVTPDVPDTTAVV